MLVCNVLLLVEISTVDQKQNIMLLVLRLNFLFRC